MPVCNPMAFLSCKFSVVTVNANSGIQVFSSYTARANAYQKEFKCVSRPCRGNVCECRTDAPWLVTCVRFMPGSEDIEAAKILAANTFSLISAGACSVTAAHHSVKSLESAEYMSLENVLRGSGDLGALLSTAWGVRQIDAESNRIYVQNLKPRDFEPCPPFIIEGRPHLDRTGHFAMIEEVAGELRDYLPRRQRGAPAMPDKKQLVERATFMRQKGDSLQKIADTLGVSKSGIRKWIGEHENSMNRGVH